MLKIIKNPFLWAFVIGIILLHITREFSILRKSAPPPLVITPDWSLKDQNGRMVSKNDFLGKIIVADFFFTSCPTICPQLTNAMKEIYERFKHNPKLVFLSISVDPETDTPEVLKQYLANNNINYDNWYALTGTKEEVYDVVINKMKIHIGEKEPIHGVDTIYDIPHLAELVLFDKEGNLRGKFKTDSVELSALVRAIQFISEVNL
jgi:protein SCO1/2